ncbi:Protein arginine N-methyltransferase 3 [Dinochytrium kinnereticum]|nr:Protein arginine N-methyltransferase 3 [Dinochytrium kinnereticum]
MSDADIEEGEETWDDWEEEENETICPSCTYSCNAKKMLEHWVASHGFDFWKFKRDHALDFYGCVRAINFIRRKARESWDFSISVDEVDSIRTDDSLMMPTLENDPLLYGVDFDQYDADEMEKNVPLGDLTLHNTSDETEQSKALELELEFLKLKHMQLEQAFGDLRQFIKEKYLNLEDDNDSEDGRDVLDYYFTSYGHSEIHEVMLKDTVRTDSYRDFIYMNKDLFKDKVVLDVGCGTGILSMFAAQAGARMVYAVDNSEFIAKAKIIAQDNGLSDKITFIRGAIEKIELPVDTVDIIISEWMGYYLLFEGMFDSVIHARDKWLKKETGVMAPSKATIFMAAVEGFDWMNDRVNYWNNVYGFKMSCIREEMYDDGQVDCITGDDLISQAVSIKALDLNKINVSELDFRSPLEIQIERDGTLTCLCGWFDILFQATGSDGNDVFFSTGPQATPTHWKQTMFLMKNPIQVQKGDILKGTIDIVKAFANSRNLLVTIEFEIKSRKIHVKQSFHIR